MTKITIDEVKRIAELAKLAVTDEEVEHFTKHLSVVFESASNLEAVNTDNVEPMTHGLQLINILREDVPADILNREEMLKSVRKHEGGQIKVPAIL